MIPNHEGQVLDDDNQQVHGVYATGWIKRGPVGLIGHTKSDAMQTVQHLVNDQGNWWSPTHPEESAIVELLDSRGVAVHQRSTDGTPSTSTSAPSGSRRAASGSR